MPKETMTPRERWLAVLGRQKPDRIPMDYWGTPETMDALKKHLKCSDDESVFKKLHIDRPLTVFAQYVGPTIPAGYDIFGCRYKKIDYGHGSYDECIRHPLAEYTSVDGIKKNYKWPSLDWWDYFGIPRQVKDKEHLPVRGGGSEPFLVYKDLRGGEQGLMDLIENPEIVHYCLDKLFELAYENTRRIYETIPGRVMMSYIAEDFGTQEDLMFSPGLIREFFLPRMKRMIELAHQNGAMAFTHSDGAVRKIIPDLIGIGVDVLNPIQWRCRGMEREQLKKDFGGKLIFHGGVDNQHTLPFGKKEDVRQEVLDNIRILGSGGGYILAPCHNIQSITPPENIVTMYQVGYENGWF